MDANEFPTSLVVFQTERMTWNRENGSYMLTTSTKNKTFNYFVDPKKGEIRPVDLTSPPEHYWKLSNPSGSTGMLPLMVVTIDVGLALNVSKSLLAVHNVPKGDWLYSRYQLVLYSYVRGVVAYVKDIKSDIPIYISPENALVTHVETYKNIKENKFFVVIHIKIRVADGFITLNKLFERSEEEGKISYVPHYKHRKVLYEMMLKDVFDTPTAATEETNITLEPEIEKSEEPCPLPPAPPCVIS
ncbi:spherical body protein, putative [Babesia ovata]|uniref:Spherical body protein, putative n=1 Tax=Babesia ovata TaxID=189622 RepID=A0A2H6KB33_9APIC|nr:spherical body protein, putative [Babesia ovata]GBE60204.1 spherical body protein, putative [Babesia ovata]